MNPSEQEEEDFSSTVITTTAKNTPKWMVFLRSRRRILSKPGHPALTCLPNGQLLGNSFGPAGQLQRFELQLHEATESHLQYVTFQGSNGKYLSVNNNFYTASTASEIKCSSKTIGDNEKWFLQNCGTGGGGGDDACCVSIMSYYGHYLTNDHRYDCGKHVTDRDQQVGMWSKWIITTDSDALTCYSAGMKLMKYGAIVTTLFFPIVVGAVWIAMNQRRVAYGGSDKTFYVLQVNNNKNNNKREEQEEEDYGEESSGIVWVPLKLFKENSSETANAVKETSDASSRAFSECRGKSSDNQYRDYEDDFVNVQRRQERESLLYEMKAFESQNNSDDEEYSDLQSERLSQLGVDNCDNNKVMERK